MSRNFMYENTPSSKLLGVCCGSALGHRHSTEFGLLLDDEPLGDVITHGDAGSAAEFDDDAVVRNEDHERAVRGGDAFLGGPHAAGQIIHPGLREHLDAGRTLDVDVDAGTHVVLALGLGDEVVVDLDTRHPGHPLIMDPPKIEGVDRVARLTVGLAGLLPDLRGVLPVERNDPLTTPGTEQQVELPRGLGDGDARADVHDTGTIDEQTHGLHGTSFSAEAQRVGKSIREDRALSAAPRAAVCAFLLKHAHCYRRTARNQCLHYTTNYIFVNKKEGTALFVSLHKVREIFYP